MQDPDDGGDEAEAPGGDLALLCRLVPGAAA